MTISDGKHECVIKTEYTSRETKLLYLVIEKNIPRKI